MYKKLIGYVLTTIALLLASNTIVFANAIDEFDAMQTVVMEDCETITTLFKNDEGEIVAIEVIFKNAESELASYSSDNRQIPDIPSFGNWTRNVRFTAPNGSITEVRLALDFTYQPTLGGQNAAFTRAFLSNITFGVAVAQAPGRQGNRAWLEFIAASGNPRARVDFTVSGSGVVTHTSPTGISVR